MIRSYILSVFQHYYSITGKDTFMRFFNHFHSLSLLLLGIVIAGSVATAWAQGSADIISKTEWRDSLSLIHNILKDLARESNDVEQYRLYFRAEDTYQQIHNILPDQEAKEIRKEMVQAYNQLAAPSGFSDEMGLRFTRRMLNNRMYYWSAPVTEGIFTEYLNARQISEVELPTMIALEPSRIRFYPENKRYQTRAPEAAVFGITHEHARQFLDWYSRSSNNEYNLPSTATVLINDDPKISCWTSDKWKDKEPLKMEAREMYGADFYALYWRGAIVGELPEASLPEVQLHLIVSAKEGKKIYYKRMRTESSLKSQ